MSGFSIQLRRVGLGALLVAGLTGCGGGDGNTGRSSGLGSAIVDIQQPGLPAPHSQCSLAAARRDVLGNFERYYLFNDEAAQQQKYLDARLNLASYGSVDALLDDLRYQSGSRDRGFTYYATVEEVQQFFSAGEFVGFGISTGIEPNGDWRIIDVFTGSPADLAGISRGATILAVDGTPVSAASISDPATFGPSEAGVSRTLRLERLDGSIFDVTLTKRVVDLDPVPPGRVQVFDVGGRRVGYIFFRTFIEAADDRLRSAVMTLAASGIDDLVLDLRYNGGGLVATAEVLGGLLAGPGRAGSLFFEYQFNAQLAGAYDDPRFFPLEPDGFPALENVYFITGAGSASASELVVSGMDPYLTRSVHIGDRTFGKPVGQWGLEYCANSAGNNTMVLFLVTFRTVNSLGAADYYDGIPVDCSAPDDWDHLLGDPEEARLQAALEYIETGGSSCVAPLVATGAGSGLATGKTPAPVRAVTGTSLAGKLLNAY